MKTVIMLSENDSTMMQGCRHDRQLVQLSGRLVGVGNISYKEKLVLEGWRL